MKTKIYTLIAITLMIASAFVGIGAMASSNDAVPPVGTGTINYLSTGVDYVPEIVNVTNGTSGNEVIFSPTVNWTDPTSSTYTGAYTVKSTSSIYTDAACTTAYSGTLISKSTTDTTVTVNGSGIAVSSVVLYIKVTSVISDGVIDIASRTTTPMKFTVNIWSTLEENSSVIIDNCYFGEEYEFDLNEIISTSTGSGEYTFATDDLNNTGLYILGDYILGKALNSEFVTPYELVVTLNVADSKTGVSIPVEIKIPMKLTKIEVLIHEDDSSVTRDMTLDEGDTGYIDQNSTTTMTMTVSNYDTAVALADVTLKDATTGSTVTISASGDTYTATLVTSLIGTHEYVINYSLNGYSASFTFYLEVVADGSAFIIVPDINIVLTG